MNKKVFVIIIKESGELANISDCYDSFDKAKAHIFDAVNQFVECRKVQETGYKNEFLITDLEGNKIHTLQILDLNIK